MTTDEKILLDKLPSDGTAVGNVTLLAQLGWQSERYWKVRNALVEKKRLSLGRGRGGSIRLVVNAAETALQKPEEIAAVAQEQKARETALYEPTAEVLGKEWTKGFGLEEYFVQVTAKQGRRETGGTWTRPDIVVIAVSTYQYVPGKFVDVITFEVKDHGNFDVTSVYEALAHMRAATRGYVFVSIPSAYRASLQKLINEVAEEAGRHGVGLIIASDVMKYETWEFEVEAVRREPDPARLDEFIETQILEENKKSLRRWLK